MDILSQSALLRPYRTHNDRWRLSLQCEGSSALLALLAVAFLHLIFIGLARADSAKAFFSEAQAERGRELYSEHCATCHGASLQGVSAVALSGPTFQIRWARAGHSVGDLFYIVRTLMPYGRPATLSKQEYIDIIAYLLSVNECPAGANELPLNPSMLDSITIRSCRP
jgi:mono/diheme cytochrome c family protein